MKDSDEEKFKDDLSRFTGKYEEYLVLVKRSNGRIHWKSSDKTWALGVIQRYKTCTDEWDREDERRYLKDLNE